MSTDEVVLFLAGDVMTGRGVDQAFANSCAPGLFEPWVDDAREYLRLAAGVNGPVPVPIAADHVWGEALAELERAAPELRIVNLETAVTCSAQAWPGKGIHYRMHPANVAALGAARIDCCALANNHVLDWGREGLAETLRTLHGAGIRTAGAGENEASARAPARLPLVHGGRVLVFARATADSGVPEGWAAEAGSSGVAMLDPRGGSRGPAQDVDALAGQILAARGPGDLVIVSLHWGGNWVPRVPDWQRRLARRLIELGAADLVHGHSSHHPLPVEVHRGKLILYGCGDLINDYEGIGPQGPLRSDLGCLYFARLSRTTGALRGLRIVPLQLRRFRLSVPDAAARRWLAQRFDDAGRESGVSLRADGAGGWTLVGLR